MDTVHEAGAIDASTITDAQNVDSGFCTWIGLDGAAVVCAVDPRPNALWTCTPPPHEKGYGWCNTCACLNATDNSHICTFAACPNLDGGGD